MSKPLKWTAMLAVALAVKTAIAQEAALKFKETCGLHAEAFSSAEVRHGPMAHRGDRASRGRENDHNRDRENDSAQHHAPHSADQSASDDMKYSPSLQPNQ